MSKELPTNSDKNNKMDIKQIQDLIRFVAKAGVSEVELETEDFKIVIKTKNENEVTTQYVQQVPQPQVIHTAVAPEPVAPQPAAEITPVISSSANTKIIKSPMIGTFYRRPSPDKEVFVKVGDTINKGDTVCIIEAMKLFNEIEAEVSGKIVKVLVDDSTPVEYDQPLFEVEV